MLKTITSNIDKLLLALGSFEKRSLTNRTLVVLVLALSCMSVLGTVYLGEPGHRFLRIPYYGVFHYAKGRNNRSKRIDKELERLHKLFLLALLLSLIMYGTLGYIRSQLLN